MKNNFVNNQLVKKAAIILISIFCLVGLTACNAKEEGTMSQKPEQVQEQEPTLEATVKPTLEPAVEPTEEPSAESSQEPVMDNQDSDSDQGMATGEASQYKNMTQLVALIGLSKDELIANVNSDHTTVDEGGIEFTQPEIRVWFDDKGKVNQIFTVSTEIDFNGLKVGDDIQTFKEKFGDPTKESNGEAHFKTGDIFISVNYDAETGKAYAVYLLKEDF